MRKAALVTGAVFVIGLLLLVTSLQFFFWLESPLSFVDFISSDNIFLDILNTPSIILFFLTPLAISILIKSDFKKFSKIKFQKIVSYSVLFLLASTILVTPFTISNSYWQPVFASSDNTTNSTDNILPSNSTQLDDQNTVEQTTSSSDNTTNSTDNILPSNSTQLDDQNTVEQTTSSSDNTTNSTDNILPSNSTQLDDQNTVEQTTSSSDNTTNSTDNILPSNPTQLDDQNTVEQTTSSSDNTTNSTDNILPSNSTQLDDQNTVEQTTSSSDNTTNSTDNILPSNSTQLDDQNTVEQTTSSSDNTTNSTDNILPSNPTQLDDQNTVEQTTSSSDNTTNSTDNILPSNPTQLDDQNTVEQTTSFCELVTNSTVYACSEKLLISDEISIIFNTNNTRHLEKLSISDEIFVILNSTNSTSETIDVPDEDLLMTPNATASLQFLDDDSLNVEFSGNATISETIQNTTSLILDGENDYVQMSVNSTDHVTHMTLSTWVKPDYSDGSPEFTILSKEKSFELSINNNISPEKIVKFSVYDGIKWNTVESYQTIPEDWTHVTVSYANDQIKIYVNGKLDNSKNIHGLSYIVINDYIDLSTHDAITSESNVIIGAYVETKHGSPTISKQFSGEIIDIQFFKEILDENQVSALYVSSIDEIVYEATDDEVLLEHEPIEIGKPVIWNQEIRLLNETNSVSVEIT